MTNDPWGNTTLDSRFDAVFGAGNWDKFSYGAANAGTIFSAGTRTVWLEGGNNAPAALSSFLTANRPAIEGWVATGGRLILNAAPNMGGNIDFGFGGVTLNYGGCCALGHSATATAVDPTHDVFAGPFAPVGTVFTGTYFSHAHITGAGLSHILLGDGGETLLTEKAVGTGLVLFGGMTSPNYHSPQPNANNLQNNIIAYADAYTVTATPEPATLALVAGGLAAVAGVARRRRGA